MGCRLGLRTLSAAAFVLAACGGNSIGQVSVNDHPRTTPSGNDAGRVSNGKDGGTNVSDGMSVADGGSIRAHSGSRLTVASSSNYYPRIWDEEKQIECEPALAADGVTRCLPAVQGTLWFTDSDCTKPIIYLDPSDTCSSVNRYFADAWGIGCLPFKKTIYTKGAPVDAPSSLYPHNAFQCSLLGESRNPVPPGPYYDPVPTDSADWIELKEELVPVTAALAVAFLNGSDGSRIPNGLRLLPSDAACESYPNQYPPPPQTRCVPTMRARRSDAYPTDQCVGSQLYASCAPTDVIEVPGTPELALFRTVGPTSKAFLISPSEGQECVPYPRAWLSGPDPHTFYSLGEPLQLDEYPSLTLTRTGSDRIQPVYMTSGGKNLVIDSYYDTRYGQRCEEWRLSDGKFWCVPGSVQMSPDYGTFADAACTRPLTVLYSAPDTPQFRFAVVVPAASNCSMGAPATLHTLIEYRGPTFSKISMGPCAPDSGFQGARLFTAGDELNPVDVVAPLPLE